MWLSEPKPLGCTEKSFPAPPLASRPFKLTKVHRREQFSLDTYLHVFCDYIVYRFVVDGRFLGSLCFTFIFQRFFFDCFTSHMNIELIFIAQAGFSAGWLGYGVRCWCGYLVIFILLLMKLQEAEKNSDVSSDAKRGLRAQQEFPLRCVTIVCSMQRST